MSCCICKGKIGTFDKSTQLLPGDDSYTLCVSCGEKLVQARNADISSENRRALKNHNDALEFFAAAMAKGLDPVIVEQLSALPGMATRKAEAENIAAVKAENERRYRQEKDSVLVTTGISFEGYTIEAYHKVVSADAIIGTGPLAETAAVISDMVGEKSNALSKKVRQAKSHAYQEMLKEAILAGGNAVLGVSYDVYVVGSMLGASVTGTAVTIAERGFVDVPILGTVKC